MRATDETGHMPSPPLRITMLGRFSLSVDGPGGDTVSDESGHSRKVWLLLAYLICNRGRTVPRDELFDLLWPEDNRAQKQPGNLANAMKTTFFRARGCLDRLWDGAGHCLLLSRDGGYAWNPQASVSLDIDRFAELCAAGMRRHDADTLLQAASLFGGGFLPKLREESQWAAEWSGQMLEDYLGAVKAAIPLLEAQGRREELAALCRDAAVHAPLDEELYLRQMSALMALERPQEAALAYEDMSQLFLSRTGALPGEALQSLYRQAMSGSGGPAIPAADLLTQLSEGPASGAFFCEYDVFRALYRLQVRDSARSGEELCLGVLSIVPRRQGSKLNRRSLDLVMENLKRLVPGLLRTGDAVARCSASQYVLLLPRAGFENGRLVCERISKAFVRQYPHSPAAIRVSVCPVAKNE